MPPPTQIGDLIEAWRARPVCFCAQGFLPPPRTSARSFVCARRTRERLLYTCTASAIKTGETSFIKYSGSAAFSVFCVPNKRTATVSACAFSSVFDNLFSIQFLHSHNRALV